MGFKRKLQVSRIQRTAPFPDKTNWTIQIELSRIERKFFLLFESNPKVKLYIQKGKK